jgi:type IV conjugative transfer system protein TraE
MMKHLLYKSQLQQLIERRNGYLLLALCSIILNIVLGFGIVNVMGYQKVILVPPVIERPSWVTSYHVSPEYLTGMSLYLADLLLNVTPENATMQHRLFLRYVETTSFNKFKADLILQEERLKKEHMTMSFQLSGLPQVDTSKFIARIAGDVSYQVGNIAMPTKHLVYLMTFKYYLGHLSVTSFEEVLPHA